MDCEIKKASDGFYHPETEEQIMREFEGESDDEIDAETIIQMGR